MFIAHTSLLRTQLSHPKDSFCNISCIFLTIATFIFTLSFAYSQETKTQQENAQSSDDLTLLFLDNKNITIGDKHVLLIFNKNECYYCEILKTSLIENPTIHGYLILNFSTYLININSKTKHNIPYLKLSGVNSLDMAKLYKITALPSMVFISTDSKEIMRIVGFPGERRLIRILEFVNNDLWKQFDTQKDRIEGFLEYEEDSH
ncbi:thioredoxin family protein [Helicobacter aurati]|nr:thioredoxin fold domain-containing protein [Helicobacter aurati]